MTWTIKPRPHVAGSPILAEYECPVHGRFERTVERDVDGNPPIESECPGANMCHRCCIRPPAYECTERRATWRTVCEPCFQTDVRSRYLYVPPDGRLIVNCGLTSPWRISAPKTKRDSVPCYAEVRGGDTERRPGMLDTRPLAEGMPRKEWQAKQRAAREERRHHQLIERGLKTKRVQV